MHVSYLGSPALKLESGLLGQFRQVLDQSEARFAADLVRSMGIWPAHLRGTGHFQLTQAMQLLASQIGHLKEEQAVHQDWREVIASINHAFWEHVDLLAAAGNEMIGQLQQTSLENWNEEFHAIVLKFKELLTHRLEDMVWAFRRLEELLLGYRAVCQEHKNWWLVVGKFWGKFASILDRGILHTLFRVDEELLIHVKEFTAQWTALQRYQQLVRTEHNALQVNPIVRLLSLEDRRLFERLYEWLHIMQRNQSDPALPPKICLLTLERLAKPGAIYLLVKHSYQQAERLLVQYSHQWQADQKEDIMSSAAILKEGIEHVIQMVRLYLQSIGEQESGLKSTLLRRWWGGKPSKGRLAIQFNRSLKELEKLAGWTQEFIEAVHRGMDPVIEEKHIQWVQQMRELFHQIDQPFSSRTRQQVWAEQFVELVEQANELCCPLKNIHKELTQAYLQALKIDSPYQTLEEQGRFHELFQLHRAFLPPLVQGPHQARMRQFHAILKRVRYRAQRRLLSNHLQELEHDVAMVQEELQRLLAAIQRGEGGENGGPEAIFTMLLDYRQLFASFFFAMRQLEGSGRLPSHHFFFVHQYFDAIQKAEEKKND